MVKLFLQTLDLSDPATIQRDLRSTEDQVNSFIRQGSVQPIDVQFQVVEFGGVRYACMLLEYNITRQ